MAFTKNGYQRIHCHQCINGGNGNKSCEPGGNITDNFLDRGCWAGELLPDILCPESADFYTGFYDDATEIIDVEVWENAE